MSEHDERIEGSEQDSVLSLNGLHTRRDFLKKAGLGTTAVAAAWMVPQVTSIGARRAYAAATGPCVPRTIDFEEFAAGTVITNQIAGIAVSTFGVGSPASSSLDPEAGLAMVFDTANPTGGDGDLGTPGSGSGNNTALGKVLIISEDGHQNDPDDNRGGGTFKFVFANPVSISTVKLLDIDNESAQVKVFSDPDCNDLITSQNAVDLGNNSVQDVNINALGGNVRSMTVFFSSSGAVAEIVCPCP